MLAAAADTRPHKADLTVGVYRDDAGGTPIMAAVREAEIALAHNTASKAYIGTLGDAEYVSLMRDLCFGTRFKVDQIVGMQTPGGSSALSVILALLKLVNSDLTVWVSDPTYVNHTPTITAKGLKVGIYPFLDRSSMALNEIAFFKTIAKLGPSDALLIQGACHNPSGVKLEDAHWDRIAEMAERQGFLPIIDTAYQGLGDGLEADAVGLITVANRVEHLAFSASCSKNFGLYNDRTGCAFLKGPNPKILANAQQQLAARARPEHWVPPQNGAAIVKEILTDPALTASWKAELHQMSNRIKRFRGLLAASLSEATNSQQYDYIATNSGMFSMLPANAEQMKTLRDDYAVYGLECGRLNIAGLREDLIEHVAKSIAAVLRP